MSRARFIASIVDAPSAGAEIATIIAGVSARHGITPSDITGVSRLRPLTAARHEVMGRALLAGYSTAQVSAALGGMDYSSVRYGARKYWAEQARARK